MEVETGRTPRTLASDRRQLWSLSGPWFPYFSSTDDNSHPPDCLQVRWHHVKQGLAQRQLGDDAVWAGPAIIKEQATQLHSPSSSRELPGGKWGRSPWLPSSGSGHVCEGLEKNPVCVKAAKLPESLLISTVYSALPLLSPSKTLGSDLRYRPGKAGPRVGFSRAASCIMHPGLQRGPGQLPSLRFPLYLPSLSIKAFIMVWVPFIAHINKIWQNCK